ncbi:MAG: polar amino acid transporter inner rane subunit [Ignavibacteria bacterium]|nr:polar amino acid transporter inner rane subunit [Ignavibacteria bacterium]
MYELMNNFINFRSIRRLSYLMIKKFQEYLKKKYTSGLSSILLKLTLIFAILFSIPEISYSQKKPALSWAADAEGNAPFIFKDPTNMNNIGFEVDIAKAIADELFMEALFVQNQWDGLIPGLQIMNYDVAINGIEITPERLSEVNFSTPYYITHVQLVVLKGSKIRCLSDLFGKDVGCLKNSYAERVLLDTAERGPTAIRVKSYEGEVNAFQDMLNGRLDAALVDAPIALYYASWNPEFQLAGEGIGEMSYGVAIRKSDTLLLRNINNALASIGSKGKLKDILMRWNLWNQSMRKYLNDYSESNIPPSEFKKYLKSQGKAKTFSERMQGYYDSLSLFGRAALTTIQISVTSMIIAIILGLVIALIRIYSPPPFSKMATAYIELIRGTPLLIQLYFIYYVLPTTGIKFTPFLAAVIGLGLNYAAYEAENYRAGLFSVPKGQMEAAISLGMKRRQALRFIIIPQALRLVIPPITNDFISLLKDSSLVSVITMVELTKVYMQLSLVDYDFLGNGIIVALVYLLLGLPFVKMAKYAERRFSVDKKRVVQ